jgi:hypothetical protein
MVFYVHLREIATFSLGAPVPAAAVLADTTTDPEAPNSKYTTPANRDGITI